MSTEAFTTPGTWLTITATLKMTAATTGWHNQRTHVGTAGRCRSAPATTTRASPAGRAAAGSTTASCAATCAPSRGSCSPMSWMRPPLAVNSITIAATKHQMLRRVIGGSPARTAAGPMRADEVDVGPDEEARRGRAPRGAARSATDSAPAQSAPTGSARPREAIHRPSRPGVERASADEEVEREHGDDCTRTTARNEADVEQRREQLVVELQVHEEQHDGEELDQPSGRAAAAGTGRRCRCS